MRNLRFLLALVALWRGAAMADQPPPITFNGVVFNFQAVEAITNGRGAYYTPLAQARDQANDEIIINYLNAKDEKGNPITAESIATAMVANIKAHNANFIFPFATPDPANKEKLIYYVLSYSIFPQDGDGEIWRARVIQKDERAVGVLLKHRITGSGAEEIEARIKAWLNENMQAQAPMIEAIPIPPEPPRG